jgi:hypothetical protein
MRSFVLCAVLCIACERPGVPQSEREAVAELCEAEARAARETSPVAAWVHRNVTHDVVRRFYDRIEAGDLEAAAALRDAAKKVGITSCRLLEPAWSQLRLPEVHGLGTEARSGDVPLVVVSRAAIGVGGKRLADVVDSRIATQDRILLTIESVTHAITNLASHPQRGLIAVDREVPYRLLIGALASATRARVKELHVLVLKDNAQVSIPVTLPTRAPKPVGLRTQPIRVVVEFRPETLTVWSLSGLEGTYHEPLATVARGSNGRAELVSALEGIVERRFGSGREADDRAITVMPMADVDAEEVLDVLSYVRRSASGRDLFSQINLASPVE